METFLVRQPLMIEDVDVIFYFTCYLALYLVITIEKNQILIYFSDLVSVCRCECLRVSVCKIQVFTRIALLSLTICIYK